MYNRMHAFPNIYPQIQEDTARMITFPLHSSIDMAQIAAHFDHFMVKDYVKSVKGTEFPAFFESTISQEDFEKWMMFPRKHEERIYGIIPARLCPNCLQVVVGDEGSDLCPSCGK